MHRVQLASCGGGGGSFDVLPLPELVLPFSSFFFFLLSSRIRQEPASQPPSDTSCPGVKRHAISLCGCIFFFSFFFFSSSSSSSSSPLVSAEDGRLHRIRGEGREGGRERSLLSIYVCAARPGSPIAASRDVRPAWLCTKYLCMCFQRACVACLSCPPGESE